MPIPEPPPKSVKEQWAEYWASKGEPNLSLPDKYTSIDDILLRNNLLLQQLIDLMGAGGTEGGGAGRPFGETVERDYETTNTTTFTEIVSYTPPSNTRFYLAKAECSGQYGQFVQVIIQGDVTGEDQIVGEGTFGFTSMYLDYFPFDTYLEGNSTKKIYIQAKAIDTADSVKGILQGELVQL